jgi:tetratricopeptide (TPR) repeat protein
MGNSPQQLKELGSQAYQNGNYTSAIEYFLEAEQGFRNKGDTLQAAEMANNLSVAYLQAGEADKSLAACKGTDLVFAAAGDLLREGFALGNQAAAYKELGDKKQSLKLYKQCAEKLSASGDKENLALVMKNISSLEMENGNQINAMSAMLDALRVKEKLSLREKFLRKLFSLAARFFP